MSSHDADPDQTGCVLNVIFKIRMLIRKKYLGTYLDFCPHLSMFTVDQMLLHGVDTTPLHLGPAYGAVGKPFPRHTNVLMGQQKGIGVQTHCVL
jgi:hypothetical protein